MRNDVYFVCYNIPMGHDRRLLPRSSVERLMRNRWPKILTWQERANLHPDHQEGMVTSEMIEERMQEEIDDIRKALTYARRLASSY
jgi:hypothetical protein